jgi:uncharacterized protein YjcR
MKGPSPIEIPSFFTVEWYRVQKELRKTDPEIANELFISLPLLAKWKKKIGWEPEQIYKLMCGRKKKLDSYEIRRLKEQGLSNKEIAKRFGVTASAIWYSLNKIAQ